MDFNEKQNRIKQLRESIANQKMWVKIYSRKSTKDTNNSKSRITLPVDLNRKFTEEQIAQRDKLYEDLALNAQEILNDLQHRLYELLYEDKEEPDQSQAGTFCEACQQNPCMCSDPERTSTTWNA